MSYELRFRVRRVNSIAHLYLNHLDQADTQLAREPYPLARMELDPGVESIFDFTYDHFRLVDYEHHPVIRAPIAV